MVRRRLALTVAAVAVLAGCASPGPAPTSVPSTVAASRSATPSQDGAVWPFASMASYLSGRQGVITAAVYDARTGRLWVYHDGVVEYTASIVKVQIMGTALWEAQARGRALPAAEAALMVPMIEHSENGAATALLSDVGGPAAVARFDRAAGLAGTTPHAAFPPIRGTPGWPAWGLTTTTARDQVILLKRFAFPNQLLTDANRLYGLSLMEHVEADQAWGISAGVAPGATIALKNGWIPGFPVALSYTKAGGAQADSVGWVRGLGRNYVLAVLTRDDPGLSYGIATVEAISRRIYAELGR